MVASGDDDVCQHYMGCRDLQAGRDGKRVDGLHIDVWTGSLSLSIGIVLRAHEGLLSDFIHILRSRTRPVYTSFGLGLEGLHPGVC